MLNQLLDNTFYPNIIIQKTNGDTTNQLTIPPGYKGATPTTSFCNYDIPGPGTHFFQDNTEVNLNVIIDTFLGNNYWLYANSSKQIVENTNMYITNCTLHIINSVNGNDSNIETKSSTTIY